MWIPISILEHGLPSSHPSVAQIISWAADRITTREDRAYSLLGLLGMHMPIIDTWRRKELISPGDHPQFQRPEHFHLGLDKKNRLENWFPGCPEPSPRLRHRRQDGTW